MKPIRTILKSRHLPSPKFTHPSLRRTFRVSMPMSFSKEPRRFAPLAEGAEKKDGLPVLKGVVFDVDGTLCVPQTYMFAQMRSALSIPKSTDILDHVYTLSPASQGEAFVKIRAIESEACATQEPQPGLLDLMTYLESKKLPKGICTRNFDAPVAHLLGKFLPGIEMSPVVTRDFRPPKPDPAGVLHNAKAWGLVKEDGEGDASQLIMVGDSIDDMTAGYLAGAATVLLVNEVNAHLVTHEHTDLCISRLDELIGILEKGFVGQIARGDEKTDTKARAEGVLEAGKAEGA